MGMILLGFDSIEFFIYNNKNYDASRKQEIVTNLMIYYLSHTSEQEKDVSYIIVCPGCLQNYGIQVKTII